MKIIRTILYVVLIVLLIISVGFLFSSCTFIMDVLGLGKDTSGEQPPGDETPQGVTISGTVYIDPSVTKYGYVYVGFVSVDPDMHPYPNPIPWADFTSKQLGESYLNLGYYDGN